LLLGYAVGWKLAREPTTLPRLIRGGGSSMQLARLVAVAFAAVLAACSPGGKQDTQAPPQGRTVIRFATDWRAQAEHGGFYQALANGEYAKRGLDVRIVQGGPGSNVPQLLAAGAVDMGMGSNSFIVLNLAREGVPVKAVAAYFQKDPQVLIAHPDQGIESLADLKGHPILLSDASVTAFWVWLKAKYGFTDDQVRKYAFSSAPFLADKRVAQQGYVTSEPYTIEKEAGLKPKVFLLADNGYPGYATMALAPDSLIADNPAAVKAFVEASAAGWRDYLHGDPSKADALIRKDNPEMTQDVLDQAREKLKSYGIVEGGDAASLGVGAMTDARWKTFFDMAAGQGVYPKDMDYRRAYTLQFVQK
jgi:NitT/TauT family transport system substrate-binding protein